MADCIPAGMELFVASDDEQFEVIKKVIDLCDYYVLIIGRRYGSIHPETKISYTEMEYDYAIAHDIPVLVFAIDESAEIEQKNKEIDKEKIQQLNNFRTKAMTNRLVSIWKSSEDLTGKLAVSIMKAKADIKRPGWQRAVDFDEASLRRDIMELKCQNEDLLDELKTTKNEISYLTEQTDVAFHDRNIIIECFYMGNYGEEYVNKQTSLVEIFVIIATEMMDVSITETVIENIVIVMQFPDSHTFYFKDKQFIKKVLNQYRALNLVFTKWNDIYNLLYWGLTDKGKKVRDDLILLRNN